MRLYVLIFSFFILLSACCTREMVVLIPDDDGIVGEVDVSGEKGTVHMTTAWNVTKVNSSGVPSDAGKISEDRVQKIFGRALKAHSRPSSFYLLYFDLGSDKVKAESMDKVSDIVEEILSRKQYEITIIGHSDSIGDDVLNLKLSEKRAKSVQRILIDHGIPAEKIVSVENYGKNVLLVPTPEGVEEPRNRRVEIFVR